MQVGEWTIDADTDRIHRDGNSIKLERRAMAVLVYLAERRAQVVSKDELIDHVWNGFAVSDHSVAIVISDLRKAFGDSAQAPKYIETIPKRGYRLIAAVSEIKGPDSPPAAVNALSVARRWPVRLSAALLALAVLATGVLLSPGAGEAEAPMAPALMVTDVANDSGNRDAAHLAFALPDLVTGNLAQYPSGRLVRARGTASQMLVKVEPGPRDAFLSGRLMRDGDTVTAAVSLTKAADGTLLWTETYPLTDGNLSSVARSIARQASAALGEQFPIPAGNAQVPPQALRHYWRARQLASSREEESLRAARQELVSALRIQPNYAEAHVALANIYAHKSGEHLGLPRLDTFAEAETHVAAAERLGLSSSETEVTRSLIALFRDRDAQRALQHARRAVQIRKSDSQAWQALAVASSIVGDHRNALKAMDQAIALDPLASDLQIDRIWLLTTSGRPRQALDGARSIKDNGTLLPMYQAMAETRIGNNKSAFRFWTERARRRGLDETSLQLIDSAAATNPAEGFKQLARAVEINPAYRENEVALASMYLSGGDRQNAERVLKQIRRTRDSWLWLWLDQMPQLAQLRSGATRTRNS